MNKFNVVTGRLSSYNGETLALGIDKSILQLVTGIEFDDKFPLRIHLSAGANPPHILHVNRDDMGPVQMHSGFSLIDGFRVTMYKRQRRYVIPLPARATEITGWTVGMIVKFRFPPASPGNFRMEVWDAEYDAPGGTE